MRQMVPHWLDFQYDLACKGERGILFYVCCLRGMTDSIGLAVI